jgi:hypothetical protein
MAFGEKLKEKILMKRYKNIKQFKNNKRCNVHTYLLTYLLHGAESFLRS